MKEGRFAPHRAPATTLEVERYRGGGWYRGDPQPRDDMARTLKVRAVPCVGTWSSARGADSTRLGRSPQAQAGRRREPPNRCGRSPRREPQQPALEPS